MLLVIKSHYPNQLVVLAKLHRMPMNQCLVITLLLETPLLKNVVAIVGNAMPVARWPEASSFSNHID